MKDKIKYLKPVLNNGQPYSLLQFKVNHDLQKNKKIKSKNVFQYSSEKKSLKTPPRER